MRQFRIAITPLEATTEVVYFHVVQASRWMDAVYAAWDIADQNNSRLRAIEEMFK